MLLQWKCHIDIKCFLTYVGKAPNMMTHILVTYKTILNQLRHVSVMFGVILMWFDSFSSPRLSESPPSTYKGLKQSFRYSIGCGLVHFNNSNIFVTSIIISKLIQVC